LWFQLGCSRNSTEGIKLVAANEFPGREWRCRVRTPHGTVQPGHRCLGSTPKGVLQQGMRAASKQKGEKVQNKELGSLYPIATSLFNRRSVFTAEP